MASVLPFAGAPAPEVSPPLSAAQIMQKVAENQDREQVARTRFVYEENLHVATRYTNGKVDREQRSQFIVTPSAKGTEKKRIAIQGRYWHKGRYIDFKGTPVPDSETLDGGLTSGFENTHAKELFPLTTQAQKDLVFDLVGEKIINTRKAYVIHFTPADRKEITWAGEALIDEEEFQPMSVYTSLSGRIPLFVRTMLGTDVPGLGFNVQYVRVDKDV